MFRIDKILGAYGHLSEFPSTLCEIVDAASDIRLAAEPHICPKTRLIPLIVTGEAPALAHDDVPAGSDLSCRLAGEAGVAGYE